MGIVDRLQSPRRPAARAQIGYAAADASRLTAALLRESEYINRTLRYQLRALRARSRQAAQNNPFARRFVSMVVTKVCGPAPFKLQAKVKFKSGDLDSASNKRIEAVWKSWGKKGECEITGKFSWNAVQRLVVRTLAVDGEFLLRNIRDANSRYGYQLQMIDIDRLDEQKNEKLSNGGAINMGVEMDPTGRPVAYYLLKRKPSNWDRGYVREYDRVPASEIIHVFVPDFMEQARGVPWMYAALLNLAHMGAFEEAAIIAAHVGASNMAVMETPDDGSGIVSDQNDGSATAGTQQQTPQSVMDVEPGIVLQLPPGYKLNSWNPKYPDAAMGPFIKACLRGIASGLDVAYHNLANDLEGVNYSSARIGELDERDAWMVLQSFITEHWHQPFYEDWLMMQVLRGNLPFDPSRLDRYFDVFWQPRRWAWVDPLKEMNAKVLAIKERLTSRTRTIAETGEDIEDIYDEIAEEMALADDHGFTDGPEPDAAPAPSSTTGDANNETSSEGETDQTDGT